MLKRYIIITLRDLYKNKLYTILKVLGLSIALTVGFAISSWVKHEMSYDTFHQDLNRIYRIVVKRGDGVGNVGFSPAVKTKIFDKIPEIESVVRLLKFGYFGRKTKIASENKVFTNNEIYYTDDDFFNIFSFPLLRGDPKSAFKKPNAVVMTEKLAKKFFGEKNPMGKILVISDKKELEVTGVVKNPPLNSHFHFDILVSLKDHYWELDSIGFGSASIFPTYIKLKEHTTTEIVQRKMNRILADLKKEFPEDVPNYNFSFQPITDIHLHSHFRMELETNSHMKYIYIFLSIGFLIIIIANINYINLTIATLSKRFKEIDIRKVMGANKKQLIFQFSLEAVIISLFSFIVALFFQEILKPIFSLFSASVVFSNFFLEGYLLVFAIMLFLIIGIMTVYISTSVLSQFCSAMIIKPFIKIKDKTGNLRKILVIFQICISIILIISTMIIYQQMKLIQNKNLGYNKDNLLVQYVGYNDFDNKIGVLKNSFSSFPGIQKVTAVSQLPTNIKTSETIDTMDGKNYRVHCMSVDRDFFETMGIKIIDGKERIKQIKYREDVTSCTIKNKFVVNQALVDLMGINTKNAINEEIVIRHGNKEKGPIIGVAEDFNFQSLHHPIGPLVFEFAPYDYEYLLIKIKPNNVQKTIQYIGNQWKKMAGNLPFEYFFLDDTYNSLYQSELQTGRLIFAFSIISILIIVLGLIGLSSFSTRAMTKEIGIRKVLGASVVKILIMLGRDFTKWVLLANLFAWPIAWYIMNKWLQNFAFRIDIHWSVFLLSGISALSITLFIVSWQSIRVAIANPVESLKYE